MNAPAAELSRTVEALLFLSSDPLTTAELADVRERMGVGAPRRERSLP